MRKITLLATIMLLLPLVTADAGHDFNETESAYGGMMGDYFGSSMMNTGWSFGVVFLVGAVIIVILYRDAPSLKSLKRRMKNNENLLLILLVSLGLIFGFSGMMGFGWIFMILFWAGVIWVLFNLSNNRTTSSPVKILKERYAKGEITKKEFDKIKGDIT